MRPHNLPAMLLTIALLFPVLLWAEIDAEKALASAKERYKDSPEAGNQALRELIEAHPGDTKLARTGLGEILGRSRELPEWTRYASTRIVALQEMGAIPWEDDIIAQLYRSRVDRYARDHHRLSAKLLFEEAKERFPQNKQVQLPEVLRQSAGYAHQAPPPQDPLQHAQELGLDKEDWLAFRRSDPGQIPEVIDGMIAANAEDAGTKNWDDGSGRIDVWTLIDLHLQKQAETLEPLRTLQEKSLHDNPDNLSLDALQLFRRFPWADTAQQRLADAAGQALMQGRPQAAYRSFADMLNHSRKPDLRAQATVGQLLALSTIGDAKALAAAFDALEPDTQLPWLGKTLSVAELRKHMQSPDAGASSTAAKLGALKSHSISPPFIRPWAHQDLMGTPELQAVDGQVLLSSRRYLAAYDANDLTKPKWLRTDESGRHFHTNDAPNSYRPTVIDGSVYARTVHGYEPEVLNVIDLATGNDQWSMGRFRSQWGNTGTVGSVNGWATVGDPSHFLSRPVLADKALFMLSLDPTKRNPNRHVSVLAVDPIRRRALWQATSNENQPPSQGRTFGIEPTIHQGVAYAVTSATSVQAIDLRDGRINWIHRYPVDLTVRLAKISCHASPAIVVDDRLICSPLDTASTFALDLKTGRLLWRNPDVGARQQIGRFGDTVLVHDGHTVAALAAEDGSIRWHQRFDSRIISRVQFAGDRVYVSTAKAIVAVSAADGSRLDQRSWNLSDGPPQATLVAKDRLLVVSYTPYLDPRQQAFNPKAAKTAGALAPPLQLAWNLPAAKHGSRVIIPPADSALAGKVYCHAMGLLTCVDASPRGGVRWQTFSSLDPEQHYLAGNLLIFRNRNSLVAYDGDTGEQRWRQSVSGMHHAPTIYGNYLLGVDGRSSVGILDVQSGKVLWKKRFDHVQGIRAAIVNDQVHLFTSRDGKLNHVVADLKTGKRRHEYEDLLSVENFGISAVTLSDKGAIVYGVSHKPKGYETAFAYALDGKKATELVNARPVAAFGDYAVTLVYHTPKKQEIVLRKIGDPNYQLKLFDGNRRMLFEHLGDRLAVFDESRLLLIDLPGKKILHDSAADKHKDYRPRFVIRDGNNILFAMPLVGRDAQPSYFLNVQTGKTTEAPHAVLSKDVRLHRQHNSPMRFPAYQNGLPLLTDQGLQFWAPSE